MRAKTRVPSNGGSGDYGRFDQRVGYFPLANPMFAISFPARHLDSHLRTELTCGKTDNLALHGDAAAIKFWGVTELCGLCEVVLLHHRQRCEVGDIG